MKNYKHLIDVEDMYEEDSTELNYEEQMFIHRKKKAKKFHDEYSKVKQKKLNKPRRYNKDYEDQEN